MATYFCMSNNLMPFNLSAAAVGGGVVPEPPRPDQAQADGGGLRVPQALVRAAGRGEPPSTAPGTLIRKQNHLESARIS